MSRPATSAVALYWLLAACEAESTEPPKCTGHIRVDERCAVVMAFDTDLPPHVVIECCEGVAVKEATKILADWLPMIRPEERIAALRRWRARRDKRRAA